MMRLCEIYTHREEPDLGKLVGRRLQKAGGDMGAFSGARDTAGLRIAHKADMDVWVEALGAMLLLDMAHLEIAARVEALPIPLAEKQSILPQALKLSRRVEDAGVKGALQDHFAAQDALNLEGFMRFRMQSVGRAWDRCVQRAAEELLLESEYRELIGVLSAFVQLQTPRMKNVYIILNPDGSCTLSDDMDSRINYESCTGDGVVSVLIGLAPERITVYDLSGGRSAMLADVLMRVFESRVKYFR